MHAISGAFVWIKYIWIKETCEKLLSVKMVQKGQKSRSLNLKIYKELDQTPLTKVVDNKISQNFSFGRFWSVMEEIGENCKGKQSNTKYNKISEFSQNFPRFRSL